MASRIALKLGAFLLLLPAACLFAAAYGALHDQLSYTVSPEYFTRFKFEQFAFAGVGALPPRLGAAVVGALATWWVGLFAGILIGLAGLGHRDPGAILRTSMRAFGLLAAVALAAGLGGLAVGWLGFDGGGRATWIDLWRPAGLVSPHRFVAVGMMHNAGYLGGALGVLGGVVLQVRAVVARRSAVRADERVRAEQGAVHRP